MSTKKPYPFKNIPLPHTDGMHALENAFHMLDIEAKKLEEWPDELLYRLSQIEHCYEVLFMSIMRRLPQEIYEYVGTKPNRLLNAYAKDPVE